LSSASQPESRPQPLTATQIARLQAAVDGFSPSDLVWASGYLAGLAGQHRSASTAAASAHPPAQRLSILVGSQTGNGKRLGERVLKAAQQRGVAARLVSLADFNPRQLRQETALLLVVSTHGDGDPPDDALALHRYLTSAQAARLPQLSYSVLALGDSSYPHFCKTGRDFDERLQALGARAAVPRVECDVDLAAANDAWIESAVSAFAALLPEAAAPARLALVETTAPAPREHLRASATLLANQRITGRQSSKEVRHVEFALDTADFDYLPGDSVSLRPHNPASVVSEILTLMQWPAATPVHLGERTLTIEAALREGLEITQLARPVVQAIAELAPRADLRDWLAAATPEAVANWLATRQLVDVLRETDARFPPQTLVSLVRPLATRAYSIASSRLASPDEVHLTVAIVNDDHEGRARPGAASNYLAALAPGAVVELQLDRNSAFRLPANDDVPLIMVGPGTGIAPFRAFIEERAARGAAGKHWLFFGERTQREDFLYQIEWQRHLREGSLTRLDLAFSRDGAQKVYVQDRLREQGAEVYAWLEAGAAFYVCGDAKRMAKDVHRALLELIMRHGGRDEDGAEEYLFELRQQGRYQRDVY